MSEVELKAFTDIVEKLGKDFKEFKHENDVRIKEVEKKGIADPLLKEKLEKMDKAIADFTTEKDKMVLKMKQLASARSTGDITDEDVSEEAMEAKKSFGEFLRDGMNVKSQSNQSWFSSKYVPGVDDKGRMQRKAMSVISDPDGGYMVTNDLNGRMVKKIFETSDMRRVASVQTIGSSALEGIRDLGEADYGWVGERSDRTETNTPQLKTYLIPVHEMYAMPAVTQTLLDDANFNPEQWLADKIADRFSRVENDAFVNGTTNTKPRGFLGYAAGTTNPGQIEETASGTNAVVTADTMMDFVTTLKSPYRAGAQFGMHRLTTALLRKLKDSQNRYLWDPGLNGKMQQQFLGYAINEFNDMPVPANGSRSIAFADWKEFYLIVDRVGIRILRDPFTSKPYIKFYTTKRTGGDVLNFEAGKTYRLGA